jgi:hypothetical protein
MEYRLKITPGVRHDTLFEAASAWFTITVFRGLALLGVLIIGGFIIFTFINNF